MPRESAQGSLSSGTWRPLLVAAPSLCTAEAAGQAAPLAAGFAASAGAAKVGTDTKRARASRQSWGFKRISRA